MTRTMTLLAILLAVALPARAGDLVKGPWLQNVSTDSITVMWENSQVEDVAPVVVYGTTEACETGSVEATQADVNGVPVYTARIQGLSPATFYHYRVLSGETDTDVLSFLTAPEPGTPGFRYYVVGDSRSNPGMWGRLTSMILQDMLEYPEHNQTFILNTGDVAENGSDYDDWDQLWPPAREALARMPLYVSLGNHEDRTTEESDGYIYGYFDFPHESSGSTDEKWFSLTYGNMHMAFVAIYAEEGYTAGPQYDWLVSDLSTLASDPDVRWTFGAIHFTPWSLGNHDEDDATDLRASLHPVFGSVPLDVVWGGHNHLYARYAPIDGVTYVTAGGGGASLHEDLYTEWGGGTLEYAEGVHHYITVDVEEDVLAVRVLDQEGMLMDWFTMGGADGDLPPLADAGPSHFTTVGASVTLDGSGSMDPEESALTYAWSQVTGPDAPLSAVDVVDPQMDPPEEGTYIYALRVDDGVNVSAPDHVRVGVYSGMATFEAVADTFVYEDDPEESFGDSSTLYLDLGTTYSPREDQHIYLRFDPTGIAGRVVSATLRLWCINPGSVASVFTSSDVSWPEDGPTWSAPLPMDGMHAGWLNPTSEDAWVEADVTPAVQADGPVTLALVPTDSNGADFQSREAEHPPQLVVTWLDGELGDPGCTITADAYHVFNGETVSFTSEATPEAGSSITSREWDFDHDGFTFTTQATGESVTHDFWGVGYRTVALRVTDDAGRTGICTAAISVMPVDLVTDEPDSGCGCALVY